MSKKYDYKKIIISLTPEDHKLWKSEYKEKGFTTLTAMIIKSVNIFLGKDLIDEENFQFFNSNQIISP